MSLIDAMIKAGWTNAHQELAKYSPKVANDFGEFETSRIEKMLYGKSPEEQYDFLHWLMAIYAMQYTDSRAAVIAWLGGAEGR